MKILHISTYDSGGAGLACIRLHKGLLENGYDSKVLVLNKTSDNPEVFKFEKTSRWLPKFIRWPILFIKLVLHKLRIPSSRFLYYQYKLDSLRAKSSPVYSLPLSDYDLSTHPLVREADLIHLHWTAGFLDWPTFFKNVSKPILWTVHDENLYFGGFHYMKEQMDNISYYQKLEERLIEIKQKSIQQCKNLSIVSLSKMMLDKSLSGRIVGKRKHYVIHNMIDGGIFRPFNQKFSRSVFNLPEDSKILLFISYYLHDRNKGFTELVLTLNELNLPDVVLFAIGTGYREVETQLEIYYSGAINDPRLLTLAYSAADTYIIPSIQEAFAQTPLEAMSCGLPIVAFPFSGTEELINENNGVRAEDFSKSSLKNAIIKALNTSYNKDVIRKDVSTRFGIKNTVEQYSEVYMETLKGQINM